MSKIYTTKTPSLKATFADVRILDAKEMKMNGENITDLWGFQDHDDFKKLMKRYTLPEDKPFILWSDKGDVVYMSFSKEITDGSSMFYSHSSLGGWTIDLPELTNGYRMFSLCDNLTFVRADFSKLTNVVDMFYNCLKLEEFKGDLSALTDGQNMFQNCYSMKRFEANVSKLGGAVNMFNGCPLEVFKGDLRNLQVADNMFKGAKLNKESVLSIVDDLKNSKLSGISGNITLGIDKTLQNDDDIESALGFSIAFAHGQTTTVTLGNNTWSITIQLN